MNEATWAFDEGAGQALTKRNLRDGMTGYAAGRDARKALVDYENVSPFTQQMRKIMPFATFNTSIPGAVGKSIAKNPMRAEAINRATGGAYFGDEPELGGHKIKLGLPTADVGAGNFAAFARKSLAEPIKGAFDVGFGGTLDKNHYAMSGQNLKNPHDLGLWLLSMGVSGMPEAQAILSAMGLSHYKAKPMLEGALQTSTGLDVK